LIHRFDSLTVCVENLGDLAVAVREPVFGPDAMELPAEQLEVLLAQPVAVASSRR